MSVANRLTVGQQFILVWAEPIDDAVAIDESQPVAWTVTKPKSDAYEFAQPNLDPHTDKPTVYASTEPYPEPNINWVS